MTSTATLHPAFDFHERAPDLKLMTSEEMKGVDGGWFKELSWGARVGFLVGGVVGAAVGAAIVGGILFALTH